MAKLNKADYTKEVWRKLKQEKKLEKAAKRAAKAKAKADSQKFKVTPHQECAFVLGNGVSRQPINLYSLKSYGPIYGCNAIYRDFDPDYLIAVDVKMVLELNRVKYQIKNPNVWTNPNKAYNTFPNLNFFSPSKGWSSGPTALWLASTHGHKKIFIIGFDFTGTDGGKHFNNIYSDTENYKKLRDGPTYYGNWLKQTVDVIRENPSINFVRVIASDNYCPDELNNFNNYKTIQLHEFGKIFGFSVENP